MQEKVHLSFLKWALGVHRKASNIGVWGETGRFPLIFEAIRLSLNYFKRIEALDRNSLVSAALREQKALNLPWFKNIKAIIKVDEIYSLDHVFAHRAAQATLKPKCSMTKAPKNHPLFTFITHDHTVKLKPVPSKKFRVGKVIETLKNFFTSCWEQLKSTSPKLEFYHSVKEKFCKEPYLDLCKGFSRRYSTTQLRISAHKLQIEQGRYANLPREQRICTWCESSLGLKIIENENHVLYECDLYSKLRSKLIFNLNNIPFTTSESESTSPSHGLNINSSNFKLHLMSILSPNHPIANAQNSASDWHKEIHDHRTLNIRFNTPAYITFYKRRSYAVNNICTFILKCFEERIKLLDDARKTQIEARIFNNVIINFLR